MVNDFRIAARNAIEAGKNDSSSSVVEKILFEELVQIFGQCLKSKKKKLLYLIDFKFSRTGQQKYIRFDQTESDHGENVQ